MEKRKIGYYDTKARLGLDPDLLRDTFGDRPDYVDVKYLDGRVVLEAD